MGSKTRLSSYCTKRGNNTVNLVTSRKINTRLACPIGLFSDDIINISSGPKAMSLSFAYNGHSDNRGDCVFHDCRVLFGLSRTKGSEFLQNNRTICNH